MATEFRWILNPDPQHRNKVKVGLTRSSIGITIYIVLSWDADPGGDDEPDPTCEAKMGPDTIVKKTGSGLDPRVTTHIFVLSILLVFLIAQNLVIFYLCKTTKVKKNC